MKYLVITGASSGIGLATAERFLQESYVVINLSRRPCPVKAATSYHANLQSPNLVTVIDTVIAEQFEKDAEYEIHLVHNAAQFNLDNALATDDETLQSVLQVNVVAVNTLNRAIIPKMSANSSVLFVGSTLSDRAVPNTFSYTPMKL